MNSDRRGDPARATISAQDEILCEDCCEMRVRTDAPIAELAREWIRFRNAEDTGMWQPRAEDGVYPDSPWMQRFVHFMRSQYSKSNGNGNGNGIGKGEREDSSVRQHQAHRAYCCPPSCPNIRARERSLPRSGPNNYAQRDTSNDNKDNGRGLSFARDNRERVGEIAKELRKAVQIQSGGQSRCSPTCSRKKDASRRSLRADVEEGPASDARASGAPQEANEESPEESNSPPLYWVDDETKGCWGMPRCCNCCEPPKGCPPCSPCSGCPPCLPYRPCGLKRLRSTSHYGPCGPCCPPPPPPRCCPPACSPRPCTPSPSACSQALVAVFNFNECSATFQQHLHSQDECDPECELCQACPPSA